MDNFTFPIPLPVIMKDEKEFAEEEAWAQYQKEALELQEAALEQQIESNQKGNIFALDQIDLLGKIADKPSVKKDKEKELKAWTNIFKLKVFEKTLLGIKGIASSLGGGLFDTLIGLMMWAFIDPNGSLMMSLINILVSLSVMVVKMFAKMLPVVIKMIFNLLPVIINAFSTIVVAVADMLPMIFKTLKDLMPGIIIKLMDAVILAVSKIGDKLPFLKPILQFIEQLATSIKNLFDPNGGEVKSKLLTFAKDTFVNLMSALGGQFKNIRSLAAEVFGEKTIRLLESALILFGLLQVAIMAHNAIVAITTFAEWAKTAAMTASLPALFAATAAIWALAAPMLPIVLAVVAVIAAFVLLYVFWDEIAEWFGKAWHWFLDNAIDMLMIGMRLLMLPFTWPVEAGLLIYKNWEKIKKKLMEGLKAFQQAFPNVSKWVSDLFSNIKATNLSDIIFKAFDIALLGIPGLLRRAFSNISGAETIRKGFEALEKWFKTTIFYAALKKAGMVGGDDEKPKTQFEKIFTNMDAHDSSEVEKAKEKFKNSSIDSETLKQVILGADVKKLGLSVEGQQELTKAISDLKQSVGGEAEFKKIQQQISTSKNDEELSKAIYKLAAQTPFQNIIGSVSNATVSKSGKR